MMKIVLNGKEEFLLKSLTISEFLMAKNWEPERVVVELNREIIPKEVWAGIVLKEDDKMEVLRFVGGGRLHG